ncbi:hypothetical protein ACJMK2_010866 [Sinanodonta woodiana]|uniref:CUB domain-containing protein n=1 Tax=Sinanodonta woodiana TaxID=1069815 RepID=A0ABD3VGT6_SINWO
MIFSFAVWITLFFSNAVYSVECIPTYYINDYCGKEISMIRKHIYTGKLLVASSDFDNFIDCVVIIESWYFNPYIAFHFEQASFDASDCVDSYVTFQDGNEESSPSVEGMTSTTCGRNKTTKVFSTTSRYLRIHYRGNPSKYHFSIIFNCFEKGPCDSYEYECDSGWCINDELKCNGFNPCGDHSDCHLKLSSGAVVGIIVGCIFFVGIAVSVTICIYCCLRKKKGFAGTVTCVSNQPVVLYSPDGQHPMTTMGTSQTNNHSLQTTSQTNNHSLQTTSQTSNHSLQT